jgi:2-methylisocitrate lyase-like PEP mutase family enzyme
VSLGAIGNMSAGAAYIRGYRDGPRIGLEETAGEISRIFSVVDVPVTTWRRRLDPEDESREEGF